MLFVRLPGLVFFALFAALCALAAPARANPMLLIDMDSLEVLHAEQAGQPWHPASLTKLMTAFVAFEQIGLGRVGLDTPVVLSRNAINQAPSKSGLPVDSALSLEDAIYVLMVKSANDVATAIAETIGGSEAGFVTMMNDAARRMGLSGTRFVNPHGLHNPAQVTTARDMALLSLYILQTYPQYAPVFATGTVRLGRFTYESQNALLTGFSGTTGMKTGYVCASGLNMVVSAERNGRRLMAVVLGGASARERNERAAELLLRGFSSPAGSGMGILALANSEGAAPTDMRPLICGAQAKDYAAAREAAFPMGLSGQPSYLNDTASAPTRVAVDLGRIRVGVPLPRPRPAHLPRTPAMPDIESAELRPGVIAVPVVAAGGGAIPIPRPRPANR